VPVKLALWVVGVLACQVAVGLGQTIAEPPSLHAMEWAAHLNDPLDDPPPKVVVPAKLSASAQQGSATLRPCKAIFGYLPYWESVEGAANIRWNLLTHAAFFSVGANADGTISNPRGWPNHSRWKGSLAQARAHGVKVILVATNFDPSSIYTLITTPAYKNAFFENIKAQILAGEADGLNIDFEGGNSPPWRGAALNAFMAELTAYLHTELPGSEVSFAGPAVNWGGWDLAGLAASCDYIFIMGYNYYYSGSATSGPCAPLTGGSRNLTRTLDDDYGTVTRNNPEKLILGYPSYGGHWTTQTSEPRSARISFVSSTWFRDDYGAALIHGRLWDTVSQTPWYRWHDGTNWHQVWYDDGESVGLKCRLAKERNLKGVGMWALNYDGALPYMWDELDRELGAAAGDADGDGIGDACDSCTDTDGDGYGDPGYPANTCPLDECPDVPAGPGEGMNGCPPVIPGDLDDDGDVDRFDVNKFILCISGVGSPHNGSSMCEKADIDSDGDVDQDDFGILQRCFSGEGVQASPECK